MVVRKGDAHTHTSSFARSRLLVLPRLRMLRMLLCLRLL